MVIKEPQLPALEAAIGRLAPGTDPQRFLTELSSPAGSALLHRLVDEVTIQETYFFREQRELEAIDWVSPLREARKRGLGVVRAWVAACSTGEEAYSMAMLACEALGSQAPSVSILATDVSGAALERAERASGYSERSVRNLPPHLRERYLARDGRTYSVKEGLRSLVRFRHHNLIGDAFPPLGEVPFDLIACRNILIYFDLPTVEKVLGSLESALRPGGVLILGAADRLTGVAGGLSRATTDPSSDRRRSTGARKRSLRRPLGLEPRPGEEMGARAVPGIGASASDRGQGPGRRVEDRIEDALLATDTGNPTRALEIIEALLVKDPLLVDAYFVRSLVELDSGDAQAATQLLRRTLYLDPSFGLAAFELGRAHDAGGETKAARRAYEQALRTLDPADDRHRAILDQVDLGDVAAACRARLQDRGGETR